MTDEGTYEDTMTATMTSRDFNQDISQAKRLAGQAPLVITNRGHAAFVLMTHTEYLRLTGRAPSILDLSNHPESADFEFEPERLKGGLIRSADLE
jgi:hypothetical protein